MPIRQPPDGSLVVEVLHLHPWKLRADVAARAARIAARNLRGLLDSRARHRQPTTLLVMLDDYFLTGKPSRIDAILKDATGTLLAAADSAGLRIDGVVRESAMATVAPDVISMLEKDRLRDGVLTPDAPYRRFGLDEVPLYQDADGDRRWTCPFLAAV